MTDLRWVKLIRVISLFLVGVVCWLYLGGCSESVSSGADTDPGRHDPELEFQRQVNRPPTARTLYAMADILAAQGRDSECEFVLKRIIQEHPEFALAYSSLAELQMRQRRVNEAIDTLSSSLRVRPRDPVLLNNLGMCWIVRRDYEKALEAFTKAAGIAPENVRYRTNMAVALGLMGRYEESLCLFRQVLPEEQANHNLNVLREAEESAKPARTAPPAASDLQEVAK
jgi:Flp pilus assembly protein TadD